jgi:hypothetical protein
MHIWTHLKPESAGKTGVGLYPEGMVEHDGHLGQLLKKPDDLGIAYDTIVVYTTDNGAEVMSWPDGGTTPYRGEKATGFEGGFRRRDPFLPRRRSLHRDGEGFAVRRLHRVAHQHTIEERRVRHLDGQRLTVGHRQRNRPLAGIDAATLAVTVIASAAHAAGISPASARPTPSAVFTPGVASPRFCNRRATDS